MLNLKKHLKFINELTACVLLLHNKNEYNKFVAQLKPIKKQEYLR